MKNLQYFLYIIAQIKYHKKKQINNVLLNFKLKIDNSKKYKVDDIENSMVYIKKLAIKQLPRL